MAMSERIVELDGVRYYTLLEGPGAREVPPVILCHALMSNLHMYDDAVKALNGAGYNTLRFDHVGHNKTPPPGDAAASYHMDDITRHMHRLVESITGQSKVQVVIGCSIGGVMALRYAMLYPQDVEAVISVAAPGIASPAKSKGPEGLWANRIQQFEEDVKTGDDKLCRLTVQRWFPGDKPEDRAARELALPMNKTCTLRGYQILADTIRDYDYSDELAKVRKSKTVVIHGSEDSAADPVELEMIATKTGGVWLVMEGAGHLPPLHQPEAFNGIVLKHLQAWQAHSAQK